VVGIAVISCLVGTMFNVMATDTGGNPWDKVRAIINELQDRVSTIEEEANQVKTIRFYEPSETIVPPPSTDFKDGANFVWAPDNSTNNAILSIRCYFRYWSEPSSGGIRYRILINDETVMSYTWLHSSTYKWTPIFMDSDSFENPSVHPLYPNQDSYTVKFQAGCETTGYVRDINVILTVVDGLPAKS